MISFLEKIKSLQAKNNSSLIVGLDLDLQKFPTHILSEKNPLLTFAKYIIDATYDKVAAYKPNMAFFEAEGLNGLEQLYEICDYIPTDIPIIIDSKRGDIGNTAKQYAKATNLIADAVTLNPYMGEDALIPFLEDKDKYIFSLVLTSNKGAQDFQLLKTESGEFIFEKVAKKLAQLQINYPNIGAVVGATRPEYLNKIRLILKDNYLLVPGIGAQGGSIEDVLEACPTHKERILFNASRSILYASRDKNFAAAAGRAANELKLEINKYND